MGYPQGRFPVFRPCDLGVLGHGGGPYSEAKVAKEVMAARPCHTRTD